MAVAHGAVLAGVGEDLRAIEREGHLPDPQHPEARRTLQHLVKAARQQLVVLATESADRLVIGMMICAEQPYGHLLVGVLLDAPTAEGARGVAIDEQPQHQRRGKLLAAAAAVIDARHAQIQQPDRIHDEVDEMILRHPIPQIGRQQKRSVVVDVDEASRHPSKTRNSFPPWRGSQTGC